VLVCVKLELALAFAGVLSDPSRVAGVLLLLPLDAVQLNAVALANGFDLSKRSQNGQGTPNRHGNHSHLQESLRGSPHTDRPPTMSFQSVKRARRDTGEFGSGERSAVASTGASVGDTSSVGGPLAAASEAALCEAVDESLQVQSVSQLRDALRAAVDRGDVAAVRVAVRALKNSVIGNVRNKQRCVAEAIPQLCVRWLKRISNSKF
jgi:hypothetical protein